MRHAWMKGYWFLYVTGFLLAGTGRAVAGPSSDGALAHLSPAALRAAMLEARAEARVVSGSSREIAQRPFAPAGFANRDENWGDEFGQGTDGPIYAFVEFGGALIVGGDFTRAGNIAVNHIARWDGTTWSPLGEGADAAVTCLAVHQGELVAGGLFTHIDGIPANHVAVWNGVDWTALGTGLNNGPYAAASYAGDLYVGGTFSTAGNARANFIARWDGAGWSPLGDGMNGVVSALVVHGADLVAAGWFSTAGGVMAPGIARWNGSNWSAPGGNPGFEPVFSLSVFEGDLVAGGWGGAVGRWNGSAWSSMAGLNDEVHTMAVHAGRLFAGGYFTRADGQPAERLAVWNGSGWSGLDFGADQLVRALCSFGGSLYIGGHFVRLQGSVPFDFRLTDHVARWDGDFWTPVGTGAEYGVLAAIEHEGRVVGGGVFSYAGGSRANNIASWDGTAWTALEEGVNGTVYVLGHFQGDLIAAGDFSQAGGQPASLIARWDGTSWHPLGGGLTGLYVDALIEHDGKLFAAGFFTSSGGTPVNNIAAWDGANWNPLGTGTSSGAVCLAVFEGDLIAGGLFTAAGGVPANRVARWNGSSWSAIGAGMNGSVLTLAVHGTHLFAGGEFTEADGLPAGSLARWTGTGWISLGPAVTGTDWPGPFVNYLASYGQDLVAGGSFSRVGELSANNIVRWDGTAFAPLGSGVSYAGDVRFGWVWGLLTLGSDLYVVGDFNSAGGNSSYGIARWRDPVAMAIPEEGTDTTVRLRPATPNPFRASARVGYEVFPAGAVKATVIDVQGRTVRRLADELVAGTLHETTWDGRDDSGRSLPSGVYYVRVETSGGRWHAKLVRAR